MDHSARLGITIPFDGFTLLEHRRILQRAEALGYTDAWTSEVDGTDGFTPLVLAASATEQMRLGVAIASVFTRGPAILAMTAAGVAEAAPGRFCLGLGTSSDVIVERWNSQPFEQPLERLRDTATVVRGILRREKVDSHLETLHVRGFRLSRPVPAPVPLFLAALRPRALRLAGGVGDGVLLNWLSAEDVPKVVAEVQAGAAEAGRSDRVEVACRIFVSVSRNREQAEQQARRLIAAYLTVPVYNRFHSWLGRGPALAPMTAAWQEGRRREALDLIPPQIVQDIILLGGPDDWRRGLARYREEGVDTPILHFLPAADTPKGRAHECLEALEDLAPAPRILPNPAPE